MKKKDLDRLINILSDLTICLNRNQDYQIDNYYIEDILYSMKEWQFELTAPEYCLTDRDKFIILIMLSTINCVLNNDEKFEYYSNMADQVADEMELTEEEKKKFIELISKYPGKE